MWPPHNFRMGAPVPLENFARTPKKSFATQSPRKRTFACAAISDATGHSHHFALQKNSEPFRRSPAGIHTRLQGRGSFVRLTYINAFAFALWQKCKTMPRCPGCNKDMRSTRSVPKLSGLAELQIFKCVDRWTVVTEAIEA